MWKLISPLALALAAAAGIAWACSVDAPFQLLDDRAETLRKPVVNSFAYELRRLAGPPGDTLRPVETRWLTPVEQRAEAEDEAVSRLRGGLDRGDTLPEAVRLYTLGALAFHNGEWDAAAALFERVRGLPEGERAVREVWATYMLGVLAAIHPGERDSAEWFEKTRAVARAGAPDPLGLAVASFGEQARPHFRAARRHADSGDLAAYVGELSQAAALYLQQAVRGSDAGTASVWIVARHMLHDADRAAAALARPELRRLAVAYVLAANPSYTPLGIPQDPDLPADTPPPPVLPPETIVGLVLEQSQDGPQVDFDRLALAAYQHGDYALARQLAPRAAGPLAAWVRAKLALQDGDDAAAARFYAQALAARGDGIEPAARDRLGGENAVMALNAGEYARALTLLLAAGDTYWGDIAHLAERVMTTGELKEAVDALPAAPPPATGAAGDVYLRGRLYAAKDAPTVHALLRDLLARRLARDGRLAEALPYYMDAATRERAAAYQGALRQADERWSDIGKAQAWYQAARLLRSDGLDIMGSEGEPDFAYWGGELDFGLGQTAASMAEPAVPADERARFAATAAQPDRRFHYRYLAVAHAERAADLLPPRSQAFAATLCRAAQWMNSSHDDGEVRRLYARYVRNGARVAFAPSFGHDCPDPDFAAAPATRRRVALHGLRATLSAHRWETAAGLIVAGLAVAGLTAAWRRRRRGPAAH